MNSDSLNRRDVLLTGTMALATAGGPLAAVTASIDARAAEVSKPNIVFILMDNLGYGEPGVYGGGITRGAPTPRIDRLAAERMRLTNFNVEAQCTPSRSAFLTGRFSIRSGTHSVPVGGGLLAATHAAGSVVGPVVGNSVGKLISLLSMRLVNESSPCAPPIMNCNISAPLDRSPKRPMPPTKPVTEVTFPLGSA